MKKSTSVAMISVAASLRFAQGFPNFRPRSASRSLTIAAAALFLFGTVGGLSAATVYGIDQQNVGFPGGTTRNIQAFAPIGQSFTPTFPSLNFVDLYTQSFAFGSATLYVEIFSGSSFGGTLLGTSDAVTLTSSFLGVTHFSFSSDVPLAPSGAYAMELFETPSSVAWGVRDDATLVDLYSRGNEIFLGSSQFPNDLYFVEGEVVEPGTFFLLGGSLAALLVLKNSNRASAMHRFIAAIKSEVVKTSSVSRRLALQRCRAMKALFRAVLTTLWPDQAHYQARAFGQFAKEKLT
jgi:hypothetical protein